MTKKPPDCPHTLIEPALDRWSECHWHLHQMEQHYHHPEPFRYALNSFIRACKEVPPMLLASTQHRRDLRSATEPARQALKASELFRVLGKTRDFIVHHGMLEVQSHGSAGTVEGHKVKITFPFPVQPWESSEDAYVRYKETCRRDKMMRYLIGPDCDSSPAIWRTWVINEFPGRDLLDVAFEAWTQLGEVLSATVQAQGGDPLDLSMPCRHDPEQVRVRRFSQREFFLEVDGIDLAEEELKWQEAKKQRETNA